MTKSYPRQGHKGKFDSIVRVGRWLRTPFSKPFIGPSPWPIPDRHDPIPYPLRPRHPSSDSMQCMAGGSITDLAPDLMGETTLARSANSSPGPRVGWTLYPTPDLKGRPTRDPTPEPVSSFSSSSSSEEEEFEWIRTPPTVDIARFAYEVHPILFGPHAIYGQNNHVKHDEATSMPRPRRYGVDMGQTQEPDMTERKLRQTNLRSNAPPTIEISKAEDISIPPSIEITKAEDIPFPPPEMTEKKPRRISLFNIPPSIDLSKRDSIPIAQPSTQHGEGKRPSQASSRPSSCYSTMSFDSNFHKKPSWAEQRRPKLPDVEQRSQTLPNLELKSQLLPSPEQRQPTLQSPGPTLPIPEQRRQKLPARPLRRRHGMILISYRPNPLQDEPDQVTMHSDLRHSKRVPRVLSGKRIAEPMVRKQLQEPVPDRVATPERVADERLVATREFASISSVLAANQRRFKAVQPHKSLRDFEQWSQNDLDVPLSDLQAIAETMDWALPGDLDDAQEMPAYQEAPEWLEMLGERGL